MGEPVFPFKRVTKGKHLFFLNSTQLPGVQSINGTFQNNATPLNFIGSAGTLIQQYPNGPQVGNVSLNYLLISNDQFLQYTGAAGFNGYIIDALDNTAKNYSFSSGYLTSYSSKGTLGEIPQVSVNINVYNKIGRLNPTDGASISTDLAAIPTNISTLPLLIPGPGSISLNYSDFNTNAVQSYNINIGINRNPVYINGQSFPYSVETSYPLEITADFTILLNDYVPKKLTDYPFNQTVQNLNVGISDYATNTNIITYGFNNMVLIGESYNASIQQNTTQVNLQFRSFTAR